MATGVANIPGFIGFGASGVGAVALGGAIDLTGLSDFAFNVPRNGTITSISAYFSTTAGVLIGGAVVTITAQLYESTAPNNIYTPVGGTAVTLLPTLSGIIVAGIISTGILTSLSITVTAQTQLLMVFSISSSTAAIATITGFASAGITIA